MFGWLKPRLQFLRRSLFKSWLLALWFLWTVFSNIATPRDNFLPADAQKKLATPTLMNHMGWKEWLLGVLVITVFAFWEGAYREFDKIIVHFSTKAKELAEAKDKAIADLEKKLYSTSRELVMPELFPEIVHGPVMNEQAKAVSVFTPPEMAQKDTEVRFQVRITNRGRAKTTLSEIALVLDPNDKRETFGVDEHYGLDKSNFVEFGCPKEFTMVFSAKSRTRLDLVNRPYVIRITDGTGNVVMTSVARLVG